VNKKNTRTRKAVQWTSYEWATSKLILGSIHYPIQ
jgi:hypothetical protein